MNENYLMLNGKRVDLTDEQIEKLGLKVYKKDCFERVECNKKYYYIGVSGTVYPDTDTEHDADRKNYEAANYCTDKSLMEQRALHEILSRLLWRFSMQNDGDKIDWHNDKQYKYSISYNYDESRYETNSRRWIQSNEQYFCTKEIAQKAIDEIILPFMKEHPEFVW